MKVLITGADGFIGKNLQSELCSRGMEELLLCNHNTTEAEIEKFTAQCTSIVHLAGVNRPKEEREFWEGNAETTRRLIDYLKKNNNIPHIIFASSAQAELDNPYGKSKLEAERILKQYSHDTGGRVTIYRFPNVFGKWCRPDYNSVVATFCYNIAREKEICIHNADAVIQLVYIDDVINAIIRSLETSSENLYPVLQPIYEVRVGELAKMLYYFKKQNESLQIPDIGDELTKKMYSTFLSYMKEDSLKAPLSMHADTRGSFTEFIHTESIGQISINIAKPGIVKGNHWHNTKVEKFLVVKGKALIKMRNKMTGVITEHTVSGRLLEVLYIPPGYVHNIVNIGEDDLITVIWANENFDKERPDTYYEEV